MSKKCIYNYKKYELQEHYKYRSTVYKACGARNKKKKKSSFGDGTWLVNRAKVIPREETLDLDLESDQHRLWCKGKVRKNRYNWDHSPEPWETSIPKVTSCIRTVPRSEWTEWGTHTPAAAFCRMGRLVNRTKVKIRGGDFPPIWSQGEYEESLQFSERCLKTQFCARGRVSLGQSTRPHTSRQIRLRRDTGSHWVLWSLRRNRSNTVGDRRKWSLVGRRKMGSCWISRVGKKVEV